MYWPTMDDNILDVVVDARFRDNTNDTWWSKQLNNDLNASTSLQNAQRDMITLYKMYVIHF